MIANKIADASGFEPHGSLVSEATDLPKCDTTTALDSVWDLFLKKNKPTPASFSFIFSLFKQTSLHVSVHFWFNKTVCVKAKFTFGLKFISIFLQMAPKRKGKRSNELSSENNEEKKTKLKGKHLFWFAVVACVSCVLFAVTPKSSANVGE